MEEADTVESLELDDGEVRVEVVADPGADGELHNLLGLGIEEVDLFFEILGGVVFFLLIDLVEGRNDSHLFFLSRDHFEVVGADAEKVEGDPIGPGVDVGGENVELVGCEGAADLFEEAV